MVAADEDALMCDFAEYYHVLNWRELKLSQASALAFGLSADSRSKMKLSGQRYRQQELLLAAVIDKLAIIAWQNTEDGQNGRNLPKSIFQAFTMDPEEVKSDIKTFKSGADFDEALRRIREG